MMSQRLDSIIQSAESRDDRLEATIWKARKAGYQGRYRDAINMLSERFMMASNTGFARLLRHRGHRFITIREFDLAIADLSYAAQLVQNEEDRVEEDGLPNARNKPVSTLKTNIWYHLGLAFYLQGYYADAINAYREGLEFADNADMQTAFTYWYYMALRRDGRLEEAGEVVRGFDTNITLIENTAYLDLIRAFKAEFDADELLIRDQDALTNATLGYGLGNWHFMNGRTEEARKIWQQIYDSGNRAAFGSIAAEAELARQK
jgi:tetratricopeptide (TPR) repeat protein